MRGFPLINLLFVLGLLGVLAVPLMLISGDREVMIQAQETPIVKAGERSVKVRVRLAHPASEAGLWSQDHKLFVWSLPQDGQDLEGRMDLPFVSHATEFELRVRWADGTPETMAEITLEPDGLSAKQQNVWAIGHIEEILTFSWK